MKNICPKRWNSIAIESQASPLHSWEWIESKKHVGARARLFFLDDDRGQAAIPVFPMRQLKWFENRMGWIPYGLSFQGEAAYVHSHLRKFMISNGILSLVTQSGYHANNQLLNQFRKSFSIGDDQQTFLLNLSDDTEELFKKFSNTTRKHIRRSANSGVTCEPCTDTDFEAFWPLYLDLAETAGFAPAVSRHEFNQLIKLPLHGITDSMHLVARKAIFEDVTIGYLLTLCFGSRGLEFLRYDVRGTAVSSIAPKALSWDVIKTSREVGVRCYDFGGCEPEKHAGIYQFKRGFGGELKRYGRRDVLLPL